MSPTKSVHRSVAILKLPKVVAQIITFAQGVVTAMTNNPKFPSPSPALSIVTAAIAALALAESLATTTRAKGSATTRNDKKAALVALLQTLRTYVQNVADGDAENSANIIQSAGFAVRNLRVAEAAEEEPVSQSHPGFARAEVVARAADFIEYARSNGAPVSGSTGAGGDSPKFLLREDVEGPWHADGALPDDRTRCCWIVKFPRNRADAADRLVLQAEAAYHRVAARLGIRTYGRVEWENDCLFVQRFDRLVTGGAVERLGLESLSSLGGVAECRCAHPKRTRGGRDRSVRRGSGDGSPGVPAA